MSADFWNEPAELIQVPVVGKGWGGGRAPTSVMKGSLAELARFLQQQDIEDIWRFTIVTATGRHIRSAELRTLIRESDLPG
jgi:hypothetical protein